MSGNRINSIFESMMPAIHLKYAFVQRICQSWPVSVMCEVLGVSPGGHGIHIPGARSVAGLARALTFLKPEPATPTCGQQRTRNKNANPVGWRFVRVLLDKTW